MMNICNLNWNLKKSYLLLLNLPVFLSQQVWTVLLFLWLLDILPCALPPIRILNFHAHLQEFYYVINLSPNIPLSLHAVLSHNLLLSGSFPFPTDYQTIPLFFNENKV